MKNIFKKPLKVIDSGLMSFDIWMQQGKVRRFIYWLLGPVVYVLFLIAFGFFLMICDIVSFFIPGTIDK